MRQAVRVLLIGLVAPLLIAASRTDRQLNLAVPAPGSALPLPPAPPSSVPPTNYQPAPLPNRDVELAVPKAGTAPSVGPSLFTRSDQYRGEAFGKGSTAQAEQEKRVKPGAGLSFRLPFAPN